ncbi:tRNA pseudouridine(55) synthase TruB [Pyruvatibacter sp.]|uniref:tRNA pseudouridine(55) synthase TruB n=1 Tax=Pyruvatibacter sp. TaxID=1981328 RepID=UPI002969F567|nr:tRNA pseudouridine(55) synthase TruB [Alphaproteobacteria bacterium]
MGRRKKGLPVSGWVVVDKPLGPTSTHVVSKVRRAFNAQKAGHAGTLDPLGSGILPVALGEATKTVPYLVDATKDYRFAVHWGEQRDTDDREGDVTATSDVRPTKDAILAALPKYVGEISQIPPKYSAIKVNGERAYDLARDGEDVELKARTVEIHDLKLIDQPSNDEAVFEMTCGKGTYVRSLARDLAQDLGTFGHVAMLRRLRVGPFSEEDAVALETITEFPTQIAVETAPDMGNSPPAPDPKAPFLLPLETALDDIPALAVSGNDAARLKQGQAVLSRGRDAPIVKGTICAMLHGQPIALCEARQGELHPTRVFNLPA